MTYELVDLLAENVARLAFIRMLSSGWSLEKAREEREKVFALSRRATCQRCKLEKHVDQFYQKTGTVVQSYCILCMKEYVTRYNSH